MRIFGLRTKLTITMVILPPVAMLSIAIVVMALWQQERLLEKRQSLESLLRPLAIPSIATNTSNAEQPNFDVVGFFFLGRKGSCIQTMVGRQPETILGRCAHEPDLQSLLNKEISSTKVCYRITRGRMGFFLDQNSSLLLVVPVRESGIVIGAIGGELSLRPEYESLRRGWIIVLVYLIVNSFILSLVGLLRINSLVLQPIRKLVSLSGKYHSGLGFSLSEVTHQGEGFGQLAFSLNSMLGRIDKDRLQLEESVASLKKANLALQRTRQEMIRTEKLASVGRLSAGLAHEIGNPLGIVKGYLDLVADDSYSVAERQEFCKRGGVELKRIDRLIRRLLDFSRISREVSESVAVHPLVQEVVSMVQLRKEADGIHFQVSENAQNDRVTASRDGLKQLLINCIMNGIDAIIDTDSKNISTGEVKIVSSNQVDDEGQNWFLLSIQDDGSGVAAKDLENVFDPFFTTKEPGQGTGLGLSVSYSLVENFGGRIEIKSEPGNGARVIIELPTEVAEQQESDD